MSTEGTQPPSIAPARPASSGVGTAPGSRPAPNGPAAPPPAAPSASRAPGTPAHPGPAATPSADDGEQHPSVGDRIKRAASAVREALPTRDHDADEAERTTPAATATTAAPAGPATGGIRTPVAPRPAGRPAEGTRPTPRPTPQRQEQRVEEDDVDAGPRRVRLAVARIDPWSVMKLAFLLSFALGIMIVVAAAVTWYTLDGLNVFTSVGDVISTLAGAESQIDERLLAYVELDRIMSVAMMIAVVDVVLLTALSTIGAFLYNIVAALVGGLHLTLTDD